jgi:threonine dehydrogenase-like Zn-dependent dehydrogenase
VSLASCVVLPAVGRPVRLDRLEVPAPAAGAVLARVRYGGVCGTDVHLQDGRLPIPVPIVLGHEGVGEVATVGEGEALDAFGRPLEPGDPIAWGSNIACGRCFYCRDVREPTLCEHRRVYGINRPADAWPGLTGAWAEVIHLEAGTTIVRLEPDTPPEAVIALGCAGPTAVHGLLHVAPVRVGDTIVVQGAGPVGLAAAMYAHLAGAGAVILVGAPASRLTLARELAIADHHLDIAEVPAAERAERVRALTPGGRGADLVVEATGVPAAVAEGLDMCRPAGRYLVLGQYTDHGPTPLNPHLVTRKQLTLLGSWAFSGAHVVEYVRTLPRLSERFDLPRLLAPFPLEDAQRALDAVRDGRVTKAVLYAGGGEGRASPAAPSSDVTGA